MPDAWMQEQVDNHITAAQRISGLLPEIQAVGELLISAYSRTPSGILYTFGNGGSAADAQHLTGELIGRYYRERRPVPAVTLSTDPTAMTCIGNDYGYDHAFSRQVTALVRPGDVVAGFTTSGNSPSVVAGLRAGRAAGATTVLFGGASGGDALEHADHPLLVPADFTPRIQEMHTLMLHMISEVVDRWAYNQEKEK